MTQDGRVIVDYTSALIVGLVIVVFFVLWLVLRAVVRHWKGQFVQRAIQAGRELKSVRKELTRLEQGAAQYPPADPEPYGATARQLHQALAQVRDAQSDCAQRRRQLFRQVPALSGNRFFRFCLRLVAAPYSWRQLDREAESLWNATRALRAQVARAWQLLEDLRRIPLLVAGRCGSLRGACDEISRTTQWLHGSGLHGQTIDAATKGASQLCADLENLPAWVFQQEESRIAHQATRESTILAWQTLGKIEEPIRKHLERFQGWQSLHQEAGRMVREMRLAVDAARQRLGQVPRPVDVSALLAGLERACAEARRLEGSYAALTVESLNVLCDRARRNAAILSQLIARSDTLKRQFIHLRDSIPLNATLLNRVETKMDQVARAPEYPIEWGPYQARLTHLRQAETRIGAIATLRTLDQLSEHVAMADELTRGAQELDADVTQVRTWRDRLIPLLERPELAPKPPWLKQAEDLYTQVSKYAPANWARKHAAHEILTDAGELADRQRRWVPARSSEPLPAGQLDRHLDRVRQLVADLEGFQERLQCVADTLARIQETEQAARQELETAHQSTERLLTLMDRARLSFYPAVVKHRQRLERLCQDGRRLVSELERRNRGLVEEKARRVAAWVGSDHKALEALMPQLDVDRKGIEDELRDEVRELQKLAPFDRERAIKEARQLLDVKRPGDVPSTGQGDDDPVARIAFLVRQAEELLQDRERLHISLGNVASQIRGRIDGPLQTLREARQEALAKFDELVELKRVSEAGWPPLACDTRWAKDLLDYAGRDEKALKDTGGTVSKVLKLLIKLVERYQNLIAEARVREEKNGKERQNLQGLADQMDRWQGQLEAYLESHRQDAAIVEAVRARLAQMDKALAKAKRRYRRDPLSYRKARQVLQEIWSLAHDKDLPIKGSRQTIKVRDIEAEFPA
jgi:hypothetical protein